MSDTTMLRRECIPDDARIDYDEEGALRLIAAERPERAFGFKVRYVVGVSTPLSTRRAWREDRACVTCAKPVDEPTNAALVILPDRTQRIAHRGECFVIAIITYHPNI